MIPIEENILEWKMKKMMKEIMRLIPGQSKEKIEALKEIVWYLGAILLGDDIHKFATYNYHTKYAKDALDTLAEYVQKNSIEEYEKIVEELKKEIAVLENKKENLSTDISNLEKYKLELKQNVSNLSDELDKERAQNYELFMDDGKVFQSDLSELYLQRKLLDSITKQKIAETKLNMIISKLSENPDNLELINNINNYFITTDPNEESKKRTIEFL